MLYINTRNKNQTYTAYRALSLEVDANCGTIAPIRLPVFTKKELTDIYKRGFNGAVAFILNKFFSKGLTAENIAAVMDFCSPASDSLDRKTLLIRFDGKIDDLEKSIFKLLIDVDIEPTVWARCAIRISLLFGVFSDLIRCGIHSADFAVVSNDTLSFVPVFYGKLMGLPVKKIIAGAAQEDAIWNYLHKCQDSCGDVFEYFIHGVAESGHKDRIITDLFSSVVSNDRARDIIANFQSIYKKGIDMNAAFSYGALQDFRSVTGENHTTIVFNN